MTGSPARPDCKARSLRFRKQSRAFSRKHRRLRQSSLLEIRPDTASLFLVFEFPNPFSTKHPPARDDKMHSPLQDKHRSPDRSETENSNPTTPLFSNRKRAAAGVRSEKGKDDLRQPRDDKYSECSRIDPHIHRASEVRFSPFHRSSDRSARRVRFSFRFPHKQNRHARRSIERNPPSDRLFRDRAFFLSPDQTRKHARPPRFRHRFFHLRQQPEPR